MIREHSFPDETYQVGIDFDGVIHKNSKGFYDGTVYDQPVEGSYNALKKLSQKYKIIIFSAKARKDRMLVNDKTGEELIWDWLKKYNLDCFVSSVTSEKPRAVFYVDDKSFRFESWENCMKDIMSHEFI